MDLFRGERSLRFRTERRWFWINVLLAPGTAGAVAVLLHQQFHASEIGLLVVIAVVYVTIARGRLLGTSIRVTPQQLPRLHRISRRCAQLVGIPEPQLFVRDDPQVPITAMGLGEPYAIVISSQWLPHFDDDELSFLIGCELGHVAAGHTRISSLFSASGRENPLVALVFGPWLRRTEYTADRIGLLCCGSMEAAVRAIYACSFREMKGEVQLEAFVAQHREIAADPSLAMGEWLGETPYAVNRLRELAAFRRSELCEHWRAEFDRRAESAQPPQAPAPPGPAPAGFMLRSLAFMVDAIVVGALMASGALVVSIDSGSGRANDIITALNADPDSAAIGHWLAAHRLTLESSIAHVPGALGIMIYSAIMVALISRTCGMMVFDLRVVRTDHSRPGPLRIIWRYLLGFVCIATVVPLLVGAFSGWWLHDRLSGTRLIRGRPV